MMDELSPIVKRMQELGLEGKEVVFSDDIGFKDDLESQMYFIKELNKKKDFSQEFLS